MSEHLTTLVRARADASSIAAMSAIAPRDVRIGCCAIRAGDEEYLLPEERDFITSRALAARRASGAARHLARGLLAELGYPRGVIGRSRFGAPLWGDGIVGSLAHDDVFAVAAVAPADRFQSLGIDIEPAEPLPDDVCSLVVSASDVAGVEDPHLTGRVIFAAKEAVYKAAHPLDGQILNYDDIRVDLSAWCAWTHTGHMAELFYCCAPRVLVLAVMRRLG